MKKLIYLFLLLIYFSCSNCSKEAKSGIDSFVGTYHMTGYSQSWQMNHPTQPRDTIDEMMTVVKVDDNTLLARGSNLSFTTMYLVDSIHFYNYRNGNFTQNSTSLRFHKPYLDDSAFYYLNSSPTPASNFNIALRGIKVH
jgi:hypothetical protein